MLAIKKTFARLLLHKYLLTRFYLYAVYDWWYHIYNYWIHLDAQKTQKSRKMKRMVNHAWMQIQAINQNSKRNEQLLHLWLYSLSLFIYLFQILLQFFNKLLQWKLTDNFVNVNVNKTSLSNSVSKSPLKYISIWTGSSLM